ncbi:MAG: exosortase/archaeosortase family protein [Phycisphaerae bacterium]|nr:exosortase/archaeosortase family protein [Phycisphaerae bacterium]
MNNKEQSLNSKEVFKDEAVIDRVWKAAILGLLFVALFKQEAFMLVDGWSNANESHGILIPLFSMYFLYQRKDDLAVTKGNFNPLGLVILLGALFAYTFSVLYDFGSPRPIMMIFALAGLVLMVGGWPVFRLVWLPVLFLLFAVEIPSSIYDRVTTAMRGWASVVAAGVLNAIPGVECESIGVTIRGFHETASGVKEMIELNVADACSGMRLLRTFVALGVAMAYLEKRSISQRVVLLVSTIPIAIFCNIVRVLLTGLIYVFGNPKYATGIWHTLLGLVMLGLAFWLYGVIAWFMNNLFVDDEDKKADDGILVVKRADK